MKIKKYINFFVPICLLHLIQSNVGQNKSNYEVSRFMRVLGFFQYDKKGKKSLK